MAISVFPTQAHLQEKQASVSDVPEKWLWPEHAQQYSAHWPVLQVPDLLTQNGIQISINLFP
jgi:hypothetical protein